VRGFRLVIKESYVPVRLRQERMKVGISMGRLAKEAGISTPFLSDLERNRRTASRDTARKISDILEECFQKMDELPKGGHGEWTAQEGEGK
jgi:predicted transcriptional regulator